jgi:hypothetical protein
MPPYGGEQRIGVALVSRSGTCSPFLVSLETLKQKAAALDAASQGELLVFLATLREERWAAEARRLGKKLDDPDPDRWLTPEDFWARVDKIPAPPEKLKYRLLIDSEALDFVAALGKRDREFLRMRFEEIKDAPVRFSEYRSRDATGREWTTMWQVVSPSPIRTILPTDTSRSWMCVGRTGKGCVPESKIAEPVS